MAPAPKFGSVPQQLGRLMIEARAEGLDFAAFWDRAVRPGRPPVQTNASSPPHGALRWPMDRIPREEWQAAINGTREGWRRAYEGELPSRSELAVLRLAALLSEGDPARLVAAA